MVGWDKGSIYFLFAFMGPIIILDMYAAKYVNLFEAAEILSYVVLPLILFLEVHSLEALLHVRVVQVEVLLDWAKNARESVTI